MKNTSYKIYGVLIAIPMFALSSGLQAQMHVDSVGNVGVGTFTPDSQIDIEASGPAFRLTNIGPGAGNWEVFVNPNTGRFNLANREVGAGVVPFKFDDGAGNNMLRIGINGANGLAPRTVSIGSSSPGEETTLDVRGSIMVHGSIVHADYVFEPDYDLMSIKENADFMWQNKHLPALPKAPEGLKGPVNLVGHLMGMLEELEKAHIYIDQLNKDNQALINGHRELLKAVSLQQDKLDRIDQLEQLVHQLITEQNGQSILTSLK
ncbi:MAG: hypothetical protein L3J22_00930 [Xanthomonadales bacterium]|nr:hypothetical protein [Xanthomonadales bacterium]